MALQALLIGRIRVDVNGVPDQSSVPCQDQKEQPQSWHAGSTLVLRIVLDFLDIVYAE